jgi:CRP/FNR family transcriptional regulator, nitrogen fixation regulation protein
MSPGHQFSRTMPDELPAGTNALVDSIELMGARISLGPNAEIYGENSRADYIYKVISGTVRTCKMLIDGRRQIGAFYLPGDIFGLEPSDEHVFSAGAVTRAEISVIKRREVILLAEWDKELTCQLWALLGRELQRAQDHFLLLGQTAPERVASFLLEMAGRAQSDHQVELPMPRQDIADYLGLTVETVSRVLTQLENRAVIALLTSKRIVLRKRALLNRLAA